MAQSELIQRITDLLTRLETAREKRSSFTVLPPHIRVTQREINEESRLQAELDWSYAELGRMVYQERVNV